MKHLLIITTLFLSGLRLIAQQPGSASKKSSSSKSTKVKNTSVRAAIPSTLSTRDRIAMRLKDSSAAETKPKVVETSTVVNGIRVSSSPATEINASTNTLPARAGASGGATNNSQAGITNTNSTGSVDANTNNSAAGTQMNVNNSTGSNIVNATATNTTAMNTNATTNIRVNDSLNQQSNIPAGRASTTVAATDATIVNKNLVNTTGKSNSSLNTNVNNNSNNQAAQVTQVNPTTGVIIINTPAAQNKLVTGEQSQYNSSDINRNQLNAINQNQNASAVQSQPAAQSQSSNTVGANQWGQNQVGENQWSTPPSVITSGFTRDFPNIGDATWSLDLNKNYGARYRLNDHWTTSTYNVNGVRLETRTEIPVTANLPDAVSIYRTKQTVPVDFTRISKIERPNKPDVYEVRLNTGGLLYLNNLGAVVSY